MTTSPAQPRYDHGLRDLVQRTADLTIALPQESLARRPVGGSPATCERSARDVRQLLTLLSASGQLDLQQLSGEVLCGFVVDRARRHSPRTARRSASAARSFVRFLHLHGVIDGRLAQAVPTVRDTRRATLPKALAPAQLRQLTATPDEHIQRIPVPFARGSPSRGGRHDPHRERRPAPGSSEWWRTCRRPGNAVIGVRSVASSSATLVGLEFVC